MKYLIAFICILGCNAVIHTKDVNITMIESTPIDGSTFDTFTYGKNIIFAFWDSTKTHSRMFKGAQWNMLATEISKHVTNGTLLVGDVDCALGTNNIFCETFVIPVTQYPTIIYSYENEPFKLYNESLDYWSLTQFCHRYFERNCALNEIHCSEVEKAMLSTWRNMSVEERIEEHKEILNKTNRRISRFETWTKDLQNNYTQEKKMLQEFIDKNENKARMLLNVIKEIVPKHILEKEEL